MTHASEGLTHWYDRQGRPCYTIKGANGNDRPTTLRDARKLGYVPSVTTIIKCADKPGLNRWQLDQMMHAALTLPRLHAEPEADWISRVWTDSKETAKKAAEKGTAIHTAIQGYFEGYLDASTKAETEPYILGTVDALNDWYPDFAWEAERSFAHLLGFGGKVDISHHAAAFVADFKTKEFGPDADLKTWDEHAMQLAAYRIGLGMPTSKCAIVYVSVTVPGLARLIEIPEKELEKGWQMFQGLLAYWKAKQNFDPSWSEEVVTERVTAEAQDLMNKRLPSSSLLCLHNSRTKRNKE